MSKFYIKDLVTQKTYIRTTGGKVSFGRPGRAKSWATAAEATAFRDTLNTPGLEVVEIAEVEAAIPTPALSGV